MKKVLLLTLLMIIGALGSQVSARWELGDQKSASDLKAGDTIVLEYRCNNALLGRYLNGSKLSPAGSVADENIYTVENGPIDFRTGAPTIYLKQVVANGYLTFNGSWQTITYSSDTADAANLQVISCGENIPWSNTYAWDQYQAGVFRPESTDTTKEISNWRIPGDGKLTNDKSVAFAHSYTYDNDDTDEKVATWAYLGTWANADNIWFWQYTDANQWNAYSVNFILDLKGDLQALIDEYATEGEYTPGTNPGYYQEDVAEAYNATLAAALAAVVGDTSDDQLRQMIANLKSAHAAVVEAYIPITEGYYYMVSAFDDYLNNFGVEKAAYANTSKMQLFYKNFDEDNGEFVFHLTKGEGDDEWWVQHYISETYVGQPSNWYASTPPVTVDKEEVQNLRLRVPGKWFWGSKKQHSTSYTPTTGSASNKEGALTSWGQWTDEGTTATNFNLWYLRKITDESKLENFAQDKAQAALNMTLKGLISEGADLYTNLFCYSTDTENPLLTEANGTGEIAEGNQIQFSTVRNQGVDYSDDYKFLIDKADTSYMQGSGNITFDISKTPQQIITFEYNTRCAYSADKYPNQHGWGNNERPNTVTFYGNNDLASDSTWTELATVKMGALPVPARVSVDLGSEYSYIRTKMIDNATGGSYFTVSELQLYKATVDEASSQYHTTAGMSAKADYLNSLLPAMREAANAGVATQGKIDTLTAAIAAVREIYADTTELANLIKECQTLIAEAIVGEGMGEVRSQSLIDSLQMAIDEARATAFQSPMSVEAVRTATSKVSAANAAFWAGLKTVEEGKWYFITNLDTERVGEAGADDAKCGGNAIYLNDKNESTSIVKWGYYDNSSNTLNADNNPKAMWRVVKVENTDYYAIQNMYTGYYLGEYAEADKNLTVSQKPVAYDIAYSGNARFVLYPRNAANKKSCSIWPKGAKNDIVCHEAVTSASGWTFQEIDPEQQEAISISDFKMNVIDVLALPYNVSNLDLFNEGVETYAVKKISQTTDDEGELITSVELYKKSTFAAGEPCIIILGDTAAQAPVEDYDLLIPFPTDMVDHTHTFVANGIVGSLHSTDCAAGTAISSNKKFYAVGEKGSTFSAFTGVIDPTAYSAEVDGVETALTLTISGLKSMRKAGDANSDGIINSADISAAYNFILSGADSGLELDNVDANQDGVVDSSDIAHIYTKIANAGAASKKFMQKLLQQLSK